MRISLKELRRQSESNPNLWHETLAAGHVEGDFVVSGAADSPPPVVVLPREHWPLWIRALAALAKDGDRGVGDVIARVVGPVGGDTYKAWYQKATGEACGCAERQEALNARYPLPLVSC